MPSCPARKTALPFNSTSTTSIPRPPSSSPPSAAPRPRRASSHLIPISNPQLSPLHPLNQSQWKVRSMTPAPAPPDSCRRPASPPSLAVAAPPSHRMLTPLSGCRRSRGSRHRQWVRIALLPPLACGVQPASWLRPPPSRPAPPRIRSGRAGANAVLQTRADRFPSSGMCKAGFAGDDAPRAVFRKSPPPPTELAAMAPVCPRHARPSGTAAPRSARLTLSQPPSSVVLATMGMSTCPRAPHRTVR